MLSGPKGGLPEKVTFKQSPEEGKEMCLVDIWGVGEVFYAEETASAKALSQEPGSFME